ncbi:hypothetical protein MBLNU13_g01690t1 [Cladosporium sp. NU13]
MALGAISRFQADEYLMMTILCFYTVVIVTINIVEHTSSNLLPPGYDIAHMTKQDIAERTLGSKLILVVENCQIVTIWGAKTCLLIMYLRLTTLRRENIAIKALLVYVGLTFVVMEILYLGVWCRPFHNYWAVPTPSVQCDAATNHLITNAVFNLSSDVAMLAVGLPMFLRLSLRLSKKVPLIGIFSLGVFVIIAAILNKVYSFSDPFSDEWVYWYVRESSTALIVANLPFVWLFYRKIFRIRSSTASRRGRYGSTPNTATRISSIRRKSVKPDVPGARKNSDPSDPNLEMGGISQAGIWSDDMTIEEMLRGDVLSSVHAKDATPITHPALFYADGSRKPKVPPVPELPEQAVLSDLGERQTSRRGSSPDLRFNGTPLSSSFNDGGSGPKAGSFV